MAGYKVEICGVNTSDLPLLKPAQAKELLVKIKSGDTQARETFINKRKLKACIKHCTTLQPEW